MVRGIRSVEAALGHGRKEPAANEVNTKAVARKSLVAARDIPAGASLTEDMIALKRPGTGLQPTMRPYLIGRTTRVAISADSLIALDMVS
jgi:sialic acid synthase SpsE